VLRLFYVVSSLRPIIWVDRCTRIPRFSLLQIALRFSLYIFCFLVEMFVFSSKGRAMFALHPMSTSPSRLECALQNGLPVVSSVASLSVTCMYSGWWTEKHTYIVPTQGIVLGRYSSSRARYVGRAEQRARHLQTVRHCRGQVRYKY
jgi:hypothetical protein